MDDWTYPHGAWVTLRMVNRINRVGKPKPQTPVPVTIRVQLEPRLPGGPPARTEWVDALAIGWDGGEVYCAVKSDYVYLPEIWVLAADVRRR